MITQAEENYLKTIPEGKIVSIVPYSSTIAAVAQDIIAKIQAVHSGLEVAFLGASGLGISGQGDVDLYVLQPPEHFAEYLTDLKRLFGEPNHEHPDSVEWSWKQDGVDVEFYLTDPNTESMQRQLKVFNILKSNEDLLHEYERLKAEMNGKPMREYQRKKYEFYNRILANNQ